MGNDAYTSRMITSKHVSNCYLRSIRFTPLILIYLSLVVPIVWVLELTMLELRIDAMNKTESDKCPVQLEQVVTNSRKETTNCTASVIKEEIVIVTKLEAVSIGLCMSLIESLRLTRKCSTATVRNKYFVLQ